MRDPTVCRLVFQGGESEVLTVNCGWEAGPEALAVEGFSRVRAKPFLHPPPWEKPTDSSDGLLLLGSVQGFCFQSPQLLLWLPLSTPVPGHGASSRELLTSLSPWMDSWCPKGRTHVQIPAGACFLAARL